MQVLVMMQNAPNASQSSTSTGDPLSNLVSAVDTNGDGSISQSELETYLEGVGGTQAQADTLYNSLQKNSAGNLTQAQLSSDMQNAAPAHGGHHHHHHHQAAASGQSGSQLFQTTDANGSGDQSGLGTFLTSLGGTAAQAASTFAAVAPPGPGGLAASAFSNAVSAFAQNATSGNQSPILAMLDSIA
jgi:hypothetical protein